ncbi:MAG: NAD(P)/FAD-dependent oxidoreductase [Bdellovibrionales bacterium]
MSNKVAIIGGGASGFFTALRIAELNPQAEIKIFEATPGFLKKVRISGGGRCNVTHNLFGISDFVRNYPRGSKELRSPFMQFQASDTIEWFKKRGIEIVAEADGRMFPKTNSSETIINCFIKEAEHYNIKTLSKHNIESIEKKGSSFLINIRNENSYAADQVVVATGSSPTGYRFAKSLGHTITDLAPSLFSFKISDALLIDRAGTSFKNTKLRLKILDDTPSKNKGFKQEGPLLITHWGLSGPAILKLSAWAAREFKTANYKAHLFVNWLGLNSLEDTISLLSGLKEDNPKTSIKNAYPRELSKSFWERLLSVLEINSDLKYSEASKKTLYKIADALFSYKFEVDGKNRYKDEFVECGGVKLKEVNFKTMESKITPNLFFTGEVLDVDGITGGFNFQNAWTTGWLAGSEIAKRSPSN